MFANLGVAVPGADAVRFIYFREFAKASIPGDDAQDGVLDQITSAPWEGKQHPEAAAWIEANQPVFDAVERACGSRKYWEPWVAEKEDDVLINVLLPQLEFSRKVARLIAARAFHKIGEHDTRGASEDLILLLRFSRLSATSQTLISNLVGMSISAMASPLVAHLCSAPTLTSQQAKQLIRRLERLPELTPIADAVDIGERFLGLDTVLQIGSGRVGLSQMMDLLLDDNTVKVNSDSVVAHLDVNNTLREFNSLYDRIADCGRADDYATFKRMQTELDAEVSGMPGSLAELPAAVQSVLAEHADPQVRKTEVTKVLTDMLKRLRMTAVGAAHGVEFRHRQEQARWPVALAVAAYEHAEDKYPETLTALVHTYLDSQPVDQFDSKPLRYKYSTEFKVKGFIVYSVGRDLDDDEGRSRDDRDESDPEDQADISIRIGTYPEPKAGG